MNHEKIYHMTFKELYPLYVQKALRKDRTEDEVIDLMLWLTGYSIDEFKRILNSTINVESFFMDAPAFNPQSELIKGKICGVNIEDIKDTRMKRIRILDKMIDELAKGKTLQKIKRSAELSHK